MSVSDHLIVVYHQQDTDYYCGAACAQMVLDQVHHYKVAPIALVYGSAHWIVVRGYTASAYPKGSTDTTYGIIAFDINNPWPPCPSFYHKTPPVPPPHSATDNCGTGGNRGVANEHISYATWRSMYMTGVPGGHWVGKFVAVCDPDPPPTAASTLSRPPMEPLSAEFLISPSQAVDQVKKSIDAYELGKRDTFAKALDRATWKQPVLVERLDQPNSYYYIVPASQDSEIPLAVIVDGRTGLYSQSIVRTAGKEDVVSLPGPEQTQAKLINQDIQLPGLRGRLHVLPATISRHPAMVWKPCRESLSPYYPFHLFTSGGQQIYVRSDGMVFTELHDQEHGL
jgi:hypothetical protein